MGIEVSADKVVTLNDQHQNGVDTSVDGNPTKGRFRGITLLHVFSRNQRGARRDDGNPLIHALKGRKGFSIVAHWRGQVMARSKAILEKAAEQLEGFDYVVPMPSSSPFCAEFAALVAQVCGAEILEPSFLRKRRVGEVLAEAKASPPNAGRDKRALASLLYAWERTNPEAIYQAKDVDVRLRLLFNAFALEGEAPELQGKRVLIVDDIFATGSSLASVREIVGNQLGAEVSAVFFLSGV